MGAAGNIHLQGSFSVHLFVKVPMFREWRQKRPVDGSKPVSGKGLKIPTTDELFCFHSSVVRNFNSGKKALRGIFKPLERRVATKVRFTRAVVSGNYLRNTKFNGRSAFK